MSSTSQRSCISADRRTVLGHPSDFVKSQRANGSSFRDEHVWPFFPRREAGRRYDSFGTQRSCGRIRALASIRNRPALHQSRPRYSRYEEGLPSLRVAEQKRIAEMLDAADALRAKRRETLAQLDALLQSTFLDMFGDPVTSGWTMVTVEAVASSQRGAIRTGPFGSQLLHSEFVDEGVRVLGIDNAVANEFREGEPRFITAQKYEQLRRYTVRPKRCLDHDHGDMWALRRGPRRHMHSDQH